MVMNVLIGKGSIGCLSCVRVPDCSRQVVGNGLFLSRDGVGKDFVADAFNGVDDKMFWI